MAGGQLTDEASLLEILQSSLQCSVCAGIFVEPLRTPCEHNFCASCVGGKPRCPICDHRLLPKDLKTSNFLLSCVEKFKLAAVAYLHETGIDILKTSIPPGATSTPAMRRPGFRTAARRPMPASALRNSVLPLGPPPAARFAARRSENAANPWSDNESTVPPARTRSGCKPAELSSPDSSVAASFFNPRNRQSAKPINRQSARPGGMRQLVHLAGVSRLKTLPPQLPNENPTKKVSAWLEKNASSSETSASSSRRDGRVDRDGPDSSSAGESALDRSTQQFNLQEEDVLRERAGLPTDESKGKAASSSEEDDPYAFVVSQPRCEKPKVGQKRKTEFPLQTELDSADKMHDAFDELLPSNVTNLKVYSGKTKIAKIAKIVDSPFCDHVFKAPAVGRRTIGHTAQTTLNANKAKIRSKSLGANIEKNSLGESMSEILPFEKTLQAPKEKTVKRQTTALTATTHVETDDASTTTAQVHNQPQRWGVTSQMKKDLKGKKMSSNPLKVKGGAIIPSHSTVVNRTVPVASAQEHAAVVGDDTLQGRLLRLDTSDDVHDSSFHGFDEAERHNAKTLNDKKKNLFDLTLPADESIGNITLESNVATRGRSDERAHVVELSSKVPDVYQPYSVTRVGKVVSSMSIIDSDSDGKPQGVPELRKGKNFGPSGGRLKGSKLNASKSSEESSGSKAPEKRGTFSLSVDTQALVAPVADTESTQELFAKIAETSLPTTTPSSVNISTTSQTVKNTVVIDTEAQTLAQVLQLEANKLLLTVKGRREGIPSLKLALEGYATVLKPRIFLCGTLLPQAGSELKTIEKACIEVTFSPGVNAIDFCQSLSNSSVNALGLNEVPLNISTVLDDLSEDAVPSSQCTTVNNGDDERATLGYCDGNSTLVIPDSYEHTADQLRFPALCMPNQNQNSCEPDIETTQHRPSKANRNNFSRLNRQKKENVTLRGNKRVRPGGSSDSSEDEKENRLQISKKTKEVSDDDNLFSDNDSNVIPASQSDDEAARVLQRKKEMRSSAARETGFDLKSYQTRNEPSDTRTLSSHVLPPQSWDQESRSRLSEPVLAVAKLPAMREQPAPQRPSTSATRSHDPDVSASEDCVEAVEESECGDVANGAAGLHGSTEDSDNDVLEPTPQKAVPLSKSRMESTKRPEKPPPMCVMSSSLSLSCRLLVKQFVLAFGVRHVPDWESSVTHLIVEPNDGCALRTLKFLCAVADKKWVLSIHWVQACLKAKRILPEDQFELSDDSYSNGPKRSRLSPKRIFENFIFFLVGPFEGDILLDSLQLLIELAGGSYTLSKPDRSNLAYGINLNCIAIFASNMMAAESIIAKAEHYLDSFHIVMVSSDWVLESISCHALKEIRENTPIKYSSEQLEALARFYPSHMLATATEDFTQDGTEDSGSSSID